MRLFFVFLLLCSCGNETSVESTETAQHAQSLEPNKALYGNVEGMVCKMGCAASIRKELNAMDGVDDVRIDFVKDRSNQELVVLYNDSKIDQELIVSTIESINNKQFIVSDVSSKNIIE